MCKVPGNKQQKGCYGCYNQDSDQGREDAPYAPEVKPRK